MFRDQNARMTQNMPQDQVSDDQMEQAMRHAHRRANARRRVGWCLLAICAVSIGIILASDPKVTALISGQETAPEDTPASAADGVQDAAARTGDQAFPVGALSAISALSKSAFATLGGGNAEAGQPGVQRASGDRSEPDDEPARGGFFSFGSKAETAKPVVSAMPQNRIPVRRAGLSNK